MTAMLAFASEAACREVLLSGDLNHLNATDSFVALNVPNGLRLSAKRRYSRPVCIIMEQWS